MVVPVIVEPAHPACVSSLLMGPHGLSKREQDVTRLVLRGDSTAQIADGLCVSPHTVQQHLKSVFEKTGSAAGGSSSARCSRPLRAARQRAARDRPRAGARGSVPFRRGPVALAAVEVGRYSFRGDASVTTSAPHTLALYARIVSRPMTDDTRMPLPMRESRDHSRRTAGGRPERASGEH